MKKLNFVIVFLLLAACEDPIKVKLDNGEKLLVVDAFLNNEDQNQFVRLTFSDAYLNTGSPPPVTDATVSVRNLTKNYVLNFSYDADGYYKINLPKPDTVFVTGNVYELSIKYNGTEYLSQFRQNRPAKIDSIQSIYYPNGNGFTQKPFYSPYLWAKDKVDYQTDYYWVKTYRNDTLFGKASDINLAIDGSNGAVTPEKAGGLDSLTFTPPITFLGFKSYAYGSKVKVRIFSINKETYLFLTQVQTQLNNTGLFAVTPQNVKTNIKTPSGAPVRAVGWFCVSSVVTATRIIN